MGSSQSSTVTWFCPKCKCELEQISLLSEESPDNPADDAFECTSSECGMTFIILTLSEE